MLDREYFKSLRKINRRERRKIFALLKVYEELDGKVAEFQEKSGLKCLSGCGRCCESPMIEASRVEMLPLAMYVVGKNPHLKDEMKIPPVENRICQFYKPDPLVPGNGRCSVYSLRPLVCRLFGFSARMDKFQRPEFVTCERIKTHFPDQIARAQDMLEARSFVPQMTDYFMKILTIDPKQGADRAPINLAFTKALEDIFISMHSRSLKKEEKDGQSG